ncbi:MAG: Flp pilus assembly protein CpaB [Bacillota bacterium]
MGKSKIWFALTLLLAILTGLFVYQYLASLRNPEAEPMATQIVARARIDAGTRITDDMLQIVEVPEKYAHPSAAPAAELVTGRFALSDIYAGEAVLLDKVATENTVTELPYKIPEGFRALTVPVNALSGVAGLLKPGHRVDVIVTYTEEDPVRDAKAVTLVQDALVLAVGQDLTGAEGAQSLENVTLALSPSDAEMVALGEFIGDLKLSARPVGDSTKPYLSHQTPGRMLQLFP